MTYKCDYDGKTGCENCENFNNEDICGPCGAIDRECPMNLELHYPAMLEECDRCGFAPNKKAIQDSGNRREFQTGAVRDMAEGKGLMVVMPPAALLRLSKHYEHGAKKYGMYNWQKGIPVSSFMDSALRHIYKYLDGWDDEDHLAAAAFNILGAMEMEAHNKDMQDIPRRKGKKSFNYPGCGSTLKKGE